MAQALNRAARLEKPLPPLLFLTDPARTPDPVACAERLPRGSGVIHRAFGDPFAVETSHRLREVTGERGLLLLIGADADLAEEVGADGVHLPERALDQTERLRLRRPGWLLTGAAHSASALAGARARGLDAALLSPVFESFSPSAGAPLGVTRFTDLVRSAGLPVYALGGVTAETAAGLANSGAAGLAAVGAFSEI